MGTGQTTLARHYGNRAANITETMGTWQPTLTRLYANRAANITKTMGTGQPTLPRLYANMAAKITAYLRRDTMNYFLTESSSLVNIVNTQSVSLLTGSS